MDPFDPFYISEYIYINKLRSKLTLFELCLWASDKEPPPISPVGEQQNAPTIFPACRIEATKRGQVQMTARVRRGTTPVSCGISTVQLRRAHGSPVQTSRTRFLFHSTPFFMWCYILLTGPGSQNPPIDSIPLLLLPSNSSILPLYLPPLLLSKCPTFKGNHHHQYNLQTYIYMIHMYLFSRAQIKHMQPYF